MWNMMNEKMFGANWLTVSECIYVYIISYFRCVISTANMNINSCRSLYMWACVSAPSCSSIWILACSLEMQFLSQQYHVSYHIMLSVDQLQTRQLTLQVHQPLTIFQNGWYRLAMKELKCKRYYQRKEWSSGNVNNNL